MILPRDPTPPPDALEQYCISGPGFSGEFSCLHEAIKILQKHKAGAVYQRLWSYVGFAESPGLMAEVQCDCEDCERKRCD